MSLRYRTTWTYWNLLVVALVGVFLLAHTGTTPAAPAEVVQVNTECARDDGTLEMRLEVGEATYRQSDVLGQVTCEEPATQGTSRLIGGFDSINVGAGGRVHLSHASAPEIVLFENSNLTLASSVGGFENEYPPLHLRRGIMAVGDVAEPSNSVSASTDPANPNATVSPTPGETPGRPAVVVVTASATVRSSDASYVLYASEEGFAWLVVSKGAVDVASATGPVMVSAGWQAWIEPGQAPPSPRPATRSIVEVEYLGDLPPVEQLTNGFVEDDDVFATCRVSNSPGVNLRFGFGQEHGIVGQADHDSVVGVSYQGVDPAWLWVKSTNGAFGWVEESGLECPYDPSLLPASDEVDADAFADIIDNCLGVFNPDQADLDRDGAGDACEDAADPTSVPPLDRDGDTVPDDLDNCGDIPNVDQLDLDGDGQGDRCEDYDGDTVPDDRDNCVDIYNPEQTDRDLDGIGEACDEQDDCEGEDCGMQSACSDMSDQPDRDGDGIADICDPQPTPTETFEPEPPSVVEPTTVPGPATEAPPTESLFIEELSVA